MLLICVIVYKYRIAVKIKQEEEFNEALVLHQIIDSLFDIQHCTFHCAAKFTMQYFTPVHPNSSSSSSFFIQIPCSLQPVCSFTVAATSLDR